MTIHRLIVVIVVVAVAILGIGAFIIWMSVGTETYSNQTTGLTFSYPASWTQMSPSEFITKADLPEAEFTWLNEVAVVDDTHNPKTCVMAGSKGNIDIARWQELKGQMLQGMENSLMTGKTVTEPLAAFDATVQGSPSLTGKFGLSDGTNSWTYRFVVVPHSQTVYYLILTAPAGSADVDTQWNKILNSIRFSK
jgi:hypothetical protein